MRRLLAVILCVALGAVHVVSLGKITEAGKLVLKGEDTAFVIPLPVLQITALEFHGLVSDYLFLKSLVFIGSTMERTERPRVTEGEWKWLYHMLDASTSLDPYFYDPYYFANANLTWDARLIEETNGLLEKGLRHRTWDPLIPFFIGFNYFYFLQDNGKAAEFLMEASRRPLANPVWASIASKLAFKERRTETSIQFLEEMLQRTDDESTKQRFKIRIEALHGILLLEQAIARYQKLFHEKPHNVEMLAAKGIIQSIPQDPYGGKYYLDPSGTVRSTTERELMPHRKQ